MAKPWHESSAVGGALLAGGVALRYLAPTFPKEQQSYASAASVVLMAGGGIVLARGFAKSAPTGGLLAGAIGSVISPPTDEQLEERTQEDIVVVNTPTTPFVGPSGPPPPNATPAETLRINNVKPGHGGVVYDNGFMSSDYDIELSLQNNNDSDWVGEIIFRLSEDYMVGDTTGTVTRSARVRARSTELVRFTLPILGTRIVGNPTISAEIGVLTSNGFQRKLLTSWIVKA